MTTLVNTTHPFLRILLPEGDYIQFVGGRLEVPEDHPDYAHIMGVATADPLTSIMVNETTCRFCGEVFTGDKAAKTLDEHTHELHFEYWQMQKDLDAAAVTQREIKSRAGYACDVCSPVQTFGSEAELAFHMQLHTAPPDLDDEGNTRGGGDDDRRPGEVERPPAARRTSKPR